MTAFHREIQALDERLEQSIHDHRMSEATVQVTDARGQPVAGVQVAVTQTSADFLFGANIFMLGGYPTAAENRRYEEAYCRLFNAATVPFYWKELEPEQGHLRFAADSEPIHRRPPPDSVVAFCEEHDLNMNGHCLVWDFVRHSFPQWLFAAPDKKSLIEKRIREIGERYGERIQRWDILNEATNHFRTPDQPDYPMPEGYEAWAFDCAARHLPPSALKMINETTVNSWEPDKRPDYHRLIRQLQAGGAQIDGIGLQWHLFSHEAQHQVLAGESLDPETMLAALDEYRPYGLPVHVSEITIHAFDNDAPGQQAQAELARDTYRLWFSHPAVHAITWWNFPDGGAVPGEDWLHSGLIDKDLEPKPAYEALDQLINHDWRTDTTVTTDADGIARFRGFHGGYQVVVQGQAAALGVHAGGANRTVLVREAGA